MRVTVRQILLFALLLLAVASPAWPQAVVPEPAGPLADGTAEAILEEHRALVRGADDIPRLGDLGVAGDALADQLGTSGGLGGPQGLGQLPPAARAEPTPFPPDLLNPPADIRDIRGLAAIPGRPWWHWALAALLLWLLVAGIIAWFVRQRKARPTVVRRPSGPSPYQRAKQALAAARAHLEAGADEAFAVAVSQALRDYLEGAYALPAPERTTEEFLGDLAASGRLGEELTPPLKRLLELCDLTKFAAQSLGRPTMEELQRIAEELLERLHKQARKPALQPLVTAPKPSAPASRPA